MGGPSITVTAKVAGPKFPVCLHWASYYILLYMLEQGKSLRLRKTRSEISWTSLIIAIILLG